MKNKYLLASFFISCLIANAQENTQKTDTLDEVVISSTRIDLPFEKNSRTIQLITAEDLKKAGISNVADALQQIAGIDIRRRGTNGMQADLYIRGGSFDQTLLLVDGIKVDDAQTGHHTMNLALPIEVIKRIEIIKGPAARIFGQNAFNGAVNIITKDLPDTDVSLRVQGGSYNQMDAAVTAGISLDKSSHIIQGNKSARSWRDLRDRVCLTRKHSSFYCNNFKRESTLTRNRGGTEVDTTICTLIM